MKTKNILGKKILCFMLTILMLLSCLSMLGVSAGMTDLELAKAATANLNKKVKENNILESKRAPLRSIALKILEFDSGGYSEAEMELLKNAISNYNADLTAGIEDGTWITADYTEIDAKLAELESVASVDEVIARIPEVKADVEQLKSDSESSKADVDVVFAKVTGLTDCNQDIHIHEECICVYCGDIKANFVAERVINYDDEICTESKYFNDLAAALSYAEKSTEYGTYYSESATVKLLDDYTVSEGVAVAVAENVVLDLNTFTFENNGAVAFASMDNFYANEGTYTGEGTVTIGDKEAAVYDNALFYFGGEYHAEKIFPMDLADLTVPTWFTAGEGYVTYTPGQNPVLTLNNATVYSNEKSHGDSRSTAIYYSGEETLTILFSGENTLYATKDYAVYGIETAGALALEGVGDDAVLNIECENSYNYGYAINSKGIAINSGVVNTKTGDGESDASYGIVSLADITIAQDAIVNVSVGKGANISAGVIFASGKLIVDGVLNSDFEDSSLFSADVIAYDSAAIDGKGEFNAVVLTLPNSNNNMALAYSTIGNASVESDFTPVYMQDVMTYFDVLKDTSLTVTKDATVDLSALNVEDITLDGKLIIDGVLILPEGFDISVVDTDFAGKGKIVIGEEEIAVTELYDNLAGYSISLGDKIAVNYFMNLTEETLADSTAKVVFTVPNGDSSYTVEIPVSEATIKGNYHVYTCEVAAKEMTSAISAKVVTSNSELLLEDYTVQQYADVILSDPDKYAAEQDIVKAMLNYGAQAQVYFGHNIDCLANSVLDQAEKNFGTYSFEEFAQSISGKQTGVAYYGSTLCLDSETALKHYFVVEDENNMPVFKVNGTVVEPVKNGNLYEIKIADIPAHKLDDMFTVEAGELKLEYGAFSYAYQASQTNKEALKNIVNALYAYNVLADAYNAD